MTLSRRHFGALLGAGLVGATLSSRRLTRAQAGSAPVRFLAVRTPHGVDRDFWIPRTASGAEPPSADMDLRELSFEGENAILTPLMDWREKITVLDGLDSQVVKEGTRSGVRTFHGHNEQGTMLTGAQPPENRDSGNFDNHPSLDFFLHGELGAQALITASVESSGGWKCMSYDAAGRPRDPEADPRVVFDNAFAGYAPVTSAPGVDLTAAETQLFAHNVSALERMRDRLRGVERERLEQHLAAIKARAPGAAVVRGTCSVTDPARARPSVGASVASVEDVERVTRSHAEVISQAFACGVARVATLQILNDYPNWYTALPEVRTPDIVAHYGSDAFRFHESLVHDYWLASGSQKAMLRRGYCAGLRWSSKLFGSVLAALDAVVDPQDPSGGSVLDNTIVFWHSEFGHDGHDMQETRHPAVIAGGGGRVLKLGRYLRLRTIASDERVPHNRLLTSIAQAVGVNIDYFGDRDLRGRTNYQGPLVPLMV